ncbi:MAG: hypothetical protein KC910_32305, partial [Candidatus Eremiobacteraeota bacterium]|nr:hypothetical protein [Candidatus Eremiobacteraeota bacterium]
GTILNYLTDRYLSAQVGDNRAPGSLRCLLQERAYNEGKGLCQRLIDYIQGSVRPDGRRGGGLVDQLGQLTRDLDRMAEELKRGFSYFSQKDSAPHSLVLYEATDIEKRYYPAYIKGDKLKQVSDAVLRRLERTVSGLSSDIAGGRTDEWTRALLGESRKVFEPIRNDFHVIKVLFSTMDEQTRGNQLRQMISRSAFWATRSGVLGTFRLPDEQIHPMVGVPGPGAGMTPADASEVTSHVDKFRQYVTREIKSDVRFYPIPDTSEIIFYQEAGGFPINYVSRVLDLRDSYLKLYTEGECLHIECQDKKFPDLAILTKEERVALEEAHECYVLGCMFDILEFRAGEYLWMERDGFQMRPHPLGDRYMVILKLSQTHPLREKLFDQIRAKLDSLLKTSEVDQLAAFAALLSTTKRNAYGDKWGKVSGEEELPFEQMMEVRVISAQEKKISESPLVRKIGPDQLGERMVELQKSPNGLLRERPDGRLAIG